MKSEEWKLFIAARESYKAEIERLEQAMPDLPEAQQKLIDSGPTYRLETPIVYNRALDDITEDSDIRLILVGDNPGRREQAEENRRYLVGPSGKIAEKFFNNNPSLNIDFRKNVIILNKTPVHTARTAGLRELYKFGDADLEKNIAESQRFMARLLLEFQKAFSSEKALPVWITGYSEMKKNGIFGPFTDELNTIYAGSDLRKAFFLYRHFSMNQFTGDLKQQAAAGEPVELTLERIGAAYRQKLLKFD